MKSFFCFTFSDKVADCASASDVSTSVNKFSWEEINKRTRNFSKQIASGGFSTVYLARLPDYGLAAVKIQSTCTQRLARIHDQELQILSRLSHPNIVKFVGHCSDDREDERALVFEYAPNGTLYDQLHTLLTWKTRMLIAFQLASALEYLHGMQIIHGDIKSANILLDQHLNCKLCDFGSAKLGFTSMVLPPSSTKMNRMMMGSQGYVDPHYLKTGLVSKKNDIYSYGVVLLELITGREAFSMERGEKLVDVIGPVVSGGVAVEEVVDPRLRHLDLEEVVDPRLRHLDLEEVVDPRLRHLDLEEVKGMALVAGKCIGCSPMVRPCASEIVASLRDKFKLVTK